MPVTPCIGANRAVTASSDDRTLAAAIDTPYVLSMCVKSAVKAKPNAHDTGTLFYMRIEVMSLDIDLIIDGECAWSRNITHNVNDMAAIVGAYHYLWRPENVGAVRAADNIENLRRSLGMMYLNYERMKAMNPENGWGDVDGLINFTKSYLDACIEYPDAIIEVSR